MMESLRVRLIFEEERILSKSQRSEGLKQSWILLQPTQLPRISNLSAHLLQVFNLHHSCPHGLVVSMDGFVLPPFESTCFLKDKDIISVKKKGSGSYNAVKLADEEGSVEEVGNVKNQPLQYGVQLLANEEFDKESGGYQSDSEEDEDAMPIANTSDGNALSNKRKASEKLQSTQKKKHRLAVPDGVKKDYHVNEIESNHGKRVLVTNSLGKKGESSNAKSKENIENSTESVESSSRDESAQRIKSDQHEGNDQRIEDPSNPPEATKKLPSRSARRKKAKRQWLRAMAKIGKKEDVCYNKRPKQRRANAEKEEVICHSKGLLYWKQSQDGHNEKKKGDTAPVSVRPGHIRFEPLDEDEAAQQSQVSVKTFQWNGITSKRKGQKWGTEKISSTEVNNHDNVNKDGSDNPDTVCSDPIEFDKLPPLPSLPKEGDVIAYQLLELSSSWVPALSEFRVGRVLWYNPESMRVMLLPVPGYPVILEKLDEHESASQPDNDVYKEDGSLEIDFSSLLNTRIVNLNNTNSGKDATCKFDGGAGNKEAISNLVPGTKNEHKQTPEEGRADVNLWDRFSKPLNSEKAELSEGNNWSSWSKETPNRSGSSYRAWRSSLGPTMGRLRSKKGK